MNCQRETVPDAQLTEYRAEMVSDGFFGYRQFVADLLIFQPASNETDDFSLPRCQADPLRARRAALTAESRGYAEADAVGYGSFGSDFASMHLRDRAYQCLWCLLVADKRMSPKPQGLVSHLSVGDDNNASSRGDFA